MNKAFLTLLLLAAAGLVAWIIAIMLLASGAKSIKRERLLGVASEA